MAETIEKILEDINADKNGIFLPYIQRDFVWDKERICNLLDSLMRRYPIGSILAWETKKAINYRRFVRHYAQDYDFDENILVGQEGATRRYILDGQQRLQSLYIVRYGSYDDEVVFFDLSSRPDGEFGYVFEFKKPDFKQVGWINVQKFLEREEKDPSLITTSLKEDGTIPSHYTTAEQDRMGTNAMRLYMIFEVYKNLHMTTLTIKDGIDIGDIAEVFVRINSEGVVLEKADLLMALIKSEWADAGDVFKRLNDTVISMGYTKNPKDFVLRACLTLLTREPGGKGDAKELADPKIHDLLRAKFKEISLAICDVLRFIADFHFIHSQHVPTFNPVLILIAYRYTHTQQAWENIKNKAKSFLFLTFLSKALAKPTNKLMKDLLAYAMDNADFNIEKIKEIFHANEKDIDVNIDALLDISMTDSLADLVLHLFYMNKHSSFNPDTMVAKDHIFPQAPLSKVKKSGKIAYKTSLRNSILNCELLTPKDNLMKSDTLPDKYLASCTDAYLTLHGIPRDPKLWDMNRYEDFLQQRRAMFSTEISQSLSGLY